MHIILLYIPVYAGELDKIEIDARDFDAESINVLVISITVNGQTAQRSVNFTGECAYISHLLR